MLESFDINWTGVLLPSLVLVLGFFSYKVLQKFFDLSKNKNTNVVLQKQLTNIVFILLLIIIFVIVLPIKDSLKNQIIALIGIVLSASIALSSATFLGNIMAGIWLRSVRNFRLGDFVEVKGMFGRVSGRGLLHTELQSIDRDLITLPNLFLATNPVTVMHSDGTIISTQLSLGYDVDHTVIEPLLIKAAEKAELDKPFVYIDSLGDYSIVYKVHGLAKDLKTTLSARSQLNRCVLDELHQAGIEIVSPTFMNQRQVNEHTFIPKERNHSHANKTKSNKSESPEDVIFDKADKAGKLDEMKLQQEELRERMDKTKEAIKHAENEEVEQDLKASYEKLKAREEKLTEILSAKSEEISREGKES
ncbi:mechanosensitive ion channel family protein [Kangiella spongicola]|uniref:Small-conductance mechanosensitive channel n=1 Tax=Kangiella spongicola TaxID=796379 RepID=A0A318D3G5_9GAMM|nr:mechanosensitive ion channel domain-containing protein [Kangiella spongicola]PXF63846.1 mechanosensitive ion channel family protein [Kangiella spongicola]